MYKVLLDSYKYLLSYSRFINPLEADVHHMTSQILSILIDFYPDSKNCSAGGRDLTFKSRLGAGNSTRAGILWKFKVKRFVRALVLLVTNTGCPKNC